MIIYANVSLILTGSLLSSMAGAIGEAGLANVEGSSSLPNLYPDPV
jgi:hypothetical protein